MRRTFIPAAMAGLALFWAPAAGAGGSDDPRLADVESFAFGIGNGMLGGNAGEIADRLGAYDVVVVDGEEASGADVSALQGEGATVLAYLSVGTIEKWRSWYDDLKQYRLSAWQNWKDEWFADVSTQGGLLFAQNGFWGFEKFGILDDGALDGWNREDVTWTYDFDERAYVHNYGRNEALDDLQAMRDLGLFTTATNYTKRSTGGAVEESIVDACSVGALPFIGDIGLRADRLPNSPYVCP